MKTSNYDTKSLKETFLCRHCNQWLFPHKRDGESGAIYHIQVGPVDHYCQCGPIHDACVTERRRIYTNTSYFPPHKSSPLWYCQTCQSPYRLTADPVPINLHLNVCCGLIGLYWFIAMISMIFMLLFAVIVFHIVNVIYPLPNDWLGYVMVGSCAADALFVFGMWVWACVTRNSWYEDEHRRQLINHYPHQPVHRVNLI
jgi:hypothetical protein